MKKIELTPDWILENFISSRAPIGTCTNCTDCSLCDMFGDIMITAQPDDIKWVELFFNSLDIEYEYNEWSDGKGKNYRWEGIFSFFYCDLLKHSDDLPKTILSFKDLSEVHRDIYSNWLRVNKIKKIVKKL